jgi:hypothetical protein
MWGYRMGRWGYSGYLAVGASKRRRYSEADAVVCAAAKRTLAPTTSSPTVAPTTSSPTVAPMTLTPTLAPTTMVPTTLTPSGAHSTGKLDYTRSIHSSNHHVAVHSARAAAGMRWGVCRSHADARADDDGADHTDAIGCAQHRHTPVPSLIQPPPPPPPHKDTHTHAGQMHSNTQIHTHTFTQGDKRAHICTHTDTQKYTHTYARANAHTRTHSRTQRHSPFGFRRTHAR